MPRSTANFNPSSAARDISLFKSIYQSSRRTDSILISRQAPTAWYFHVPPAFADALDSVVTTRANFGRHEYGESQGCLFSFSRGDCIWDSPQYPTWGERLEHTTVGVQVKSASPATAIPRSPGNIVFDVNLIESKAVKKIGTLSMTQDEFVLFLIVGPHYQDYVKQLEPNSEFDELDFLINNTDKIPIHDTIEFDYFGDDHRVVSASHIINPPPTYNNNSPERILIGHDHTAHGSRSFYPGSMTNIYSTITGEVYPDRPSIRDFLGSIEQLKSTDHGRYRLIMLRHAPIITALVYLAKVDAKFLKSERTELIKFINSISDSPISEDFLQKKLTHFVVSDDAFDEACITLSKLPPPVASKLRSAALAVIKADGIIKNSESKAFERLQNALAR